jgi:hypothetical protein
MDGVQIPAIPDSLKDDDEVYEVVHIDEVQHSALTGDKGEVLGPSDLIRVRFRLPNDIHENGLERAKLLQRQIQINGAHFAKFVGENYKPGGPLLAEAASDVDGEENG